MESFVKIAQGTATSAGKCSEGSEDCTSHFTTIPFEDFDNVAIHGGGRVAVFLHHPHDEGHPLQLWQIVRYLCSDGDTR